MNEKKSESRSRLDKFFSLHLPKNRNQWALSEKNQCKKVVALLDNSFPEEILHAAGIVPYHLIGTYKAATPRADAWRLPVLCRYCHHVLESLLSEELNFVDGIIHTDWDDDQRRFYDICRYIRKPTFNYLIHIPRNKSESSYRWYAKQLLDLIRRLEITFNVTLTYDSLRKSILIYAKMRELLSKLYELRKKQKPPVSGAETMAIVMASFFMPKEDFILELESLMDFLEKREVSLTKIRPRLLLISDHMHLTDYLHLVEDEGSLICMDDLDSGSRYFWNSHKFSNPLDDPVYFLAKRHVSNSALPYKWFWEKHADQVIQWVKDYKIDGVLQMPHIGDANRLCCTPYLFGRLERAGIPAMSFTRDYHMSNAGQLRTRIDVFFEALHILE